MCFVLYAGTQKALPRSDWDKNARGVFVESLTENDLAIRNSFDGPEVQYIGSSTCCSCNFGYVTLQNGEWPELDEWAISQQTPEENNEYQRDRKVMVELLRNTGEKSVELYGVWDGDFAEPPKSREEVAIERILEPSFRFKERGYYRVTI